MDYWLVIVQEGGLILWDNRPSPISAHESGISLGHPANTGTQIEKQSVPISTLAPGQLGSLSILNNFIESVFIEGVTPSSKSVDKRQTIFKSCILENQEFLWHHDKKHSVLFILIYAQKYPLVQGPNILEKTIHVFTKYYIDKHIEGSPRNLALLQEKLRSALSFFTLNENISKNKLGPNTSIPSNSSLSHYGDDERFLSDTSDQGMEPGSAKSAASGNEANRPSKKKQEKKGKIISRSWDDNKVTKEDIARLDFSKQHGDGIDSVDYTKYLPKDNTAAAEIQELIPDRFDGSISGDLSDVESCDSSVNIALENPTRQNASASESRILSFFRTITGTKKIKPDELQSVIRPIKLHLIQKNVAAPIADLLCDEIQQGLEQHPDSLGTFRQATALVKDRLEPIINSILTPSKSNDLFVDMAQAKTEKRPYSVCFVGVNGVGKSTNLSKVAYWSLKKNFRVLIVACDTFRSGAVEQLRIHVKALSHLFAPSHVQLYEKGYGKDASSIAKEALQFAKGQGFDVVLIDTAGRMQDNEPLMRALGKLVSENGPDKIVFVGEALVGNEAVDQLCKFNQAIKNHTTSSSNPRQIDGIILSKFDTIDDKVGAALSMSYTAKAPILFVGTGQTYTDLKVLNIKSIIQSLLDI